MQTVKRVWKNQFIKGGVLLTISTAVINILNYFFNVFAARSLGPSGLGDIAAMMSYVMIFSVPTGIINAIIIRKIGRAGHNELQMSVLLERYFKKRLVRWWWVVALGLVVIPFVPRLTNLSALTGYSLIPVILLAFIGSFYSAAIQGLKLFTIFSVVMLAAAIIKFAGAVVYIPGVGQLSVIILFFIASVIMTTACTYVAFHKKLRGIAEPEQSHDKRLVHVLSEREFVMTTVSVLTITMFNNLDVILARRFLPAADAGLYSSWSLLAKIIFYALGPLFTVTFVYFTRNGKATGERTSFLRSLLFFGVLGVLSYGFYVTFASTLVTHLFGTRFIRISPFLGAASIFGTLYSLTSFVNNYFLAKGRRESLILTALFVPYVIGFSIMPKHIDSIIMLNVAFSIIASLVYVFAYARSILYNGQHTAYATKR